MLYRLKLFHPINVTCHCMGQEAMLCNATLQHKAIQLFSHLSVERMFAVQGGQVFLHWLHTNNTVILWSLIWFGPAWCRLMHSTPCSTTKFVQTHCTCIKKTLHKTLLIWIAYIYIYIMYSTVGLNKCLNSSLNNFNNLCNTSVIQGLPCISLIQFN